MSKIAIHAIYDDEEPLMETAKELRTKGIKVKEVFSPFPIHGIDALIGFPRPSIAICAFTYVFPGFSL